MIEPPVSFRLSGSYVPILILPDQEKLHEVDEDEQGVVNNKRQLFEDDHPRQQAGTGDQDQDECHGGQVAHLLCSYCLGKLGDAGEVY